MRDPAGIAAAIREAKSVCVCGHVNPDGDAIGSTLAARLILTGMGKEADVFFQDKVPDYLKFLPGADIIRTPDKCEREYDLFLSLDVSDPKRLGSCADLMEKCAHSAQIDHHGTNPGFTEVNSVDENAAATCCMVLEQMKKMDAPLTREIAMCLYTGISTDTGNFSFDCTNEEAFRGMCDLLEAGLPLAELNMKLFRERSAAQLKLIGRAIESLRFDAKGQIAVMTLTRKDFADCRARQEHADTVVNFGLETIGTKMAVLGREADDGTLKFSLRARAPLTVDDVAARLGGGGHAQAAGISMEGELQDATRRVVEEMSRRLEEL